MTATQRHSTVGILVCALAVVLAIPAAIGLLVLISDQLTQGKPVEHPDGSTSIHLSGAIGINGTPLAIWHFLVWLAVCLLLFLFGFRMSRHADVPTPN